LGKGYDLRGGMDSSEKRGSFSEGTLREKTRLSEKGEKEALV